MINFICGKLAEVLENSIVIDHNGMGYEVSVTQSVFHKLPNVGETVKVYTYLQMREDNVALFGFATKEELRIFKLLITVSGIGPKGAIGILSALTCDELRYAVLSQDAKAIAKAPGIGAKTAAKLILELKDKFSMDELLTKGSTSQEQGQVNLFVQSGMEEMKKEAAEALIALGYTGSEALKVVNQVQLTAGMTVEDIIKAGLRQL